MNRFYRGMISGTLLVNGGRLLMQGVTGWGLVFAVPAVLLLGVDVFTEQRPMSVVLVMAALTSPLWFVLVAFVACDRTRTGRRMLTQIDRVFFGGES